MPAGRMYRHRKAKKKKRRRKPAGRQLVAVTDAGFKNILRSGLAIIPPRVKTKLIYSTRFVLNVSSGLLFQNIFRGNSVYDPDFTGGGHQPTGFDELAALYQRYVVTGSKCELIAATDATGAGACVEYCLLPTTSSAAYSTTDPERLPEKPYANFKILSPGRGESQMSQYMTTMRQFGKSRQQVVTDDIFDATVLANPTSEWYWWIIAQTCDESSTQDAFMYVKLTYYVEFFMPEPLASS